MLLSDNGIPCPPNPASVPDPDAPPQTFLFPFLDQHQELHLKYKTRRLYIVNMMSW